MKVLIMGYVWPEPESSAAGLRTRNLIETFQGVGWEVVLSSASSENSFSLRLKDQGIELFNFKPNDATFDSDISRLNPDIVIFDRFVTEEQFGWRVRESCPEALRVIDTQDLHFLRRTREAAHQTGSALRQVLEAGGNLTEDTCRELGAILRSDHSLIISDHEMNLLREEFKIPESRLFLSRFQYPPRVAHAGNDFESRSDFVMIGNFRHHPNADGIRWFHQEIWPLIRKELPEAKVRIYGAYPPKEMMSLTDSKLGFFVEGPVQDQFKVLRASRVNLAPLRFGAGIKGKITDGWWAGTPVVTTPIGSEGMAEDLLWGGEIAWTATEFAEKAVRLATDKERWLQCQTNGWGILTELYDQSVNAKALVERLLSLKKNQVRLRAENILGAILNSHQHKSTKYFSKWIEEKNKKKAGGESSPPALTEFHPGLGVGVL
jgi:glycosyltransferase involved in cell wall biosynthesis